MITKLIWGCIVVGGITLLLWRLYRIWKEERRSHIRENMEDAAAEKRFWKETAEQVTKESAVKGGGEKDKKKVEKFIRENR